ncbi:MAG: diaminopimelate dehydrogenase [Bacteroidales bacterium]|nr:diaminopimelate dehydrogenase [Bacteroidales bacterium]
MSVHKHKIAILGYGNIGKGLALACSQNSDIELVGIFTRRKPQDIIADFPVFHASEIIKFKNKIDVVALCGGSAKDLPEQIIEIAKDFNTIDSYDNHANIPEYFEKVNTINLKHKTLSLISVGWDPGLFSLARLLGLTIIPEGKDYTFWGEGVSQGHSDAIRQIEGVKLAVQHTIPKQNIIDKIKKGDNSDFSATERHERLCFVVADNDAIKKDIESQIKNMPNYFAGYKTTVNFITEEEFLQNHRNMPHGGSVIRTGESANGNKQILEFSLNLESNPEFTSAVLLAYARAVSKLAQEKVIGCKTIFDIPPIYLTSETRADIIKNLL